MSNEPKTLNDKAWDKLFDKYDILNQIDLNKNVVISAKQIKEFREPRLMAKFDHKINLPQVFKSNSLSILPISRGDYLISHFQTYKTFECLNSNIIKASLPSHIQSLDSLNINSEAIAINCALASGVLSDFLNEQELTPTVSGRMGSDKFTFSINDCRTRTLSTVSVNGSQIEIDAAFEGINSLSLLEAKCDISNDFLVRQLYYPYRLWNSRITKRVRPIFLVYSNSIFSLYEYEFMNPMHYNSLKLINHKNYTIEDTSIDISEIIEINLNIRIQNEQDIAFPQADSFSRVINLCELLSKNDLNREEVTNEYAFDIRQTNYYTDAGRYLGLIEKKSQNSKPLYCLTQKGKTIMKLKYKQRQLELCKCILAHQVFHDTFKLCIQRGIIPTKSEIVTIMKACNLYNVKNDSTFERRASTISGWLNWIIGLFSL